MKLFIKNMVSIRCKMLVKSELEKLGLHDIMVELGEVEIKEELSSENHDKLKTALHKSGLELMDDKKSILIEQIKTVIIEMVHYSDELPKTKFSNYLSKKLNHDYTYLSNIFSEVKGVNISHFILMHKIERAKELIVYNDKLTLSEIAWKLHYSSAAHLSNQFKKITGLTPTHFKYMKRKRLIALDSL
jgi:AraC-like DNA-binding protein